MIMHGIKKCKVGNYMKILDEKGNVCYHHDVPLQGVLVDILPANVSPSAEKMSQYLRNDSLYPKTRAFKKDRLVINLEDGGYVITPIPLNGHQIEKVTKSRKAGSKK